MDLGRGARASVAPRAKVSGIPWPAVNVALVEWLMLPDAPDPAVVLADLLRRPEWHQRAACRGVGVAGFVLAHGGGGYSRELCAVCPVRQECLAVAIADPLIDGLWGGTTPVERKRMRRARVA